MGMIVGGRVAAVPPAGPSVVGNVIASGPPSSYTPTFPVGTSSGDLAVLVMVDWSGSFPTTPAGWIFTSYVWSWLGYKTLVYSKVLSAGDIASPPVFASMDSGIIVDGFVVRGATSFVVRQFVDFNELSTAVFTGFTPNVATKGALVFVQDRDAGSTPAKPGDWTWGNNPHNGLYFMGASAYKLDYAGGSVTWTSFTATLEQIGILGELL